ncbi:MAG: ferredoxin [candidate division WOR-3 bacterium]
MRVSVDEETCIGCGLCTETCPDVFEMKDDKATVKMDEVPEDLFTAVAEVLAFVYRLKRKEAVNV